MHKCAQNQLYFFPSLRWLTQPGHGHDEDLSLSSLTCLHGLCSHGQALERVGEEELRTISTQLAQILKAASKVTVLAPTSSISLFGSASKKQVRWARLNNMSEIQLRTWFKNVGIKYGYFWKWSFLILVLFVCSITCLKCVFSAPLYFLQLVPVKEIDGTTSQDIFTVLNFGKWPYCNFAAV